MRKFIIFILLLVGIVGIGFLYDLQRNASIPKKIYVAVETDGVIAVINPETKKVIRKISLSVEYPDGVLGFSPHNVQVSPDNKTVWVTANAGAHQMSGIFGVQSAYAHGSSSEPDQIIVIDALKDKIISRITTVPGVHLAHVVLAPDGNYAYATAQNQGVIYKIDTRTYTIAKIIKFPEASQPHGLRITPDGTTAYIAMFGSNALGILNLGDDSFRQITMGSPAVQAGITPDGAWAMVSLYGTKELALYNTKTVKVSKVALPKEAKGPIQMYPTPDSKYVYLADQGYYNGLPGGNMIYKIDLTTRQIIKSIRGGDGPHGVAVSADGTEVYVTNLMSGDMSVISTVDDTEIVRIPVGKSPNGVSVWTKPK